MNKHTPGPWFAVKYLRSNAYRVTTSPDDARGDICNVLAGLGAQASAEVTANASLIAAAPELLEALKARREQRREKIAHRAQADEALAFVIACIVGFVAVMFDVLVWRV
jgi:hypothetical protein